MDLCANESFGALGFHGTLQSLVQTKTWEI